MGNIGVGEILIIVLVVFFLYGPERLPSIAKKIRSFLAEWNDVKRKTVDAVKEIEKDVMGTIEEEPKKPEATKNQ
jgi:Sec-independent protein translocase protein TatA